MSRQLHRRALAHRLPGWWDPGRCTAPGTPATLRASCLCLRAACKGVSRGRPAAEGLGSREVSGASPVPTWPLGVGFPSQGTGVGILGSWGEATPPWAASFRDQAPVLRVEQGPLWPPQPSVP